MQNLKAGDIYDKSKVLRVDKKAGLFLEIPSPTPSPGFISVCETVVNILLYSLLNDVKALTKMLLNMLIL